MSTEMELTIYARGERAEDALKAIEADKQWKDTGYDANGEVVTAYTDLLPAEWRPLLQYIATRYDVLLEVYTELTSPDAWEIGEGLDGIGGPVYFAPTEYAARNYELLLTVISAIKDAEKRMGNHKEARAQALSFLTPQQFAELPVSLQVVRK